MVARCLPSPAGLVVTFERDGEPPVRLELANGRQAMSAALGLLCQYRELLPGDRLTVSAAE